MNRIMFATLVFISTLSRENRFFLKWGGGVYTSTADISLGVKLNWSIFLWIYTKKKKKIDHN